jgi:hypothetical protein
MPRLSQVHDTHNAPGIRAVREFLIEVVREKKKLF